MGGRMRRVTGDQFDFFSTDFTFENGMHLLSQCRQIDGCENEISEYLVGTEGSTNCRGTIWDKEGKIVWQYQEAAKEQETPGQVTMLDPEKSDISPYDQEHVDLVTAIRTNKPINEAENTAKSTLTAIMARVSAYTGKETTWEQMMSMDLKLGPAEYVMGPDPDDPADRRGPRHQQGCTTCRIVQCGCRVLGVRGQHRNTQPGTHPLPLMHPAPNSLRQPRKRLSGRGRNLRDHPCEHTHVRHGRYHPAPP